MDMDMIPVGFLLDALSHHILWPRGMAHFLPATEV